MKIILEFDSQEELDRYIQQRTDPFNQMEVHGDFNPTVRIPDLSRRKRGWTEYEDSILVKYYPTKSVRWIAATLRKTQATVNMRISKLRAKGANLPKKRNANGQVKEEALWP